MATLVMAIDGGTESVRVALICARTGKLCSSASAPYPTHTPANGWAEQDPEDWWDALGYYRYTTYCIIIISTYTIYCMLYEGV